MLALSCSHNIELGAAGGHLYPKPHVFERTLFSQTPVAHTLWYYAGWLLQACSFLNIPLTILICILRSAGKRHSYV